MVTCVRHSFTAPLPLSPRVFSWRFTRTTAPVRFNQYRQDYFRFCTAALTFCWKLTTPTQHDHARGMAYKVLRRRRLRDNAASLTGKPCLVLAFTGFV